MHILVYQAVSQNNVLTRMSESLARELARQGLRTSLAAIDRSDGGKGVMDLLSRGGFDHALAFGSFSADLLAEDGRSVYDAFGCGFIGWDVDHPVYQFDRFAAPIARRVQVCASEEHVRFAGARMGCRTAAWLATPGVDAVLDDPLPLDERPIYATALISWLGEPEMTWSHLKGSPTHDLIEGIVGRMLADPAVSVLDAYDAALADLGLEIRFDRSVCAVLADLALFVRRYDRVRAAHAMASLDVPRVICGTGWRDRLGDRPHLHYGDDVEFGRLDALYGRSRTVVNLNAANGASERAILAMACGAVAVSDYSPLLRVEFYDRGALRFFDRRVASSLADTILDVLGSDEAQAVADRGRERVAEAHLWSHKAAELADLLRREPWSGAS